MKRSTRFTLIELLVILSTIVFLCSLLLPALAKAQVMVEEVGCRDNLSNIGVAATIYSNDNNGELLQVSGPNFGIFTMRALAKILDPDSHIFALKGGKIVDNHELFSCPSLVDTSSANQSSYGVNPLTCQLDWPPENISKTSWNGNLRRIGDPSEAYLVMDFPRSELPVWWKFRQLRTFIWSRTAYPTEWIDAILRHDDASNMIFADGHAAPIELDLTDEEALRPLSGYDQ